MHRLDLNSSLFKIDRVCCVHPNPFNYKFYIQHRVNTFFIFKYVCILYIPTKLYMSSNIQVEGYIRIDMYQFVMHAGIIWDC